MKFIFRIRSIRWDISNTVRIFYKRSQSDSLGLILVITQFYSKYEQAENRSEYEMLGDLSLGLKVIFIIPA